MVNKQYFMGSSRRLDNSYLNEIKTIEDFPNDFYEGMTSDEVMNKANELNIILREKDYVTLGLVDLDDPKYQPLPERDEDGDSKTTKVLILAGGLLGLIVLTTALKRK